MLISIELANEEVVVDLIRLVLAVQVGEWEAECAAGAQCQKANGTPGLLGESPFPGILTWHYLSRAGLYLGIGNRSSEGTSGKGFLFVCCCFLELGSLNKGDTGSSPVGFSCHSGIRLAQRGRDPGQPSSF